MAKDLPYFKFIVSEWNDGDITLCGLESQGLFINLCSLYWSNEGQLSYSKCKRRYKDCNTTVWDQLINDGIIKVEGDAIIINFLDEQFEERNKLSAINKKNIEKRWKKGVHDTVVLPSNNGRSELEYNIEKKREEENREEKKVLSTTVDEFEISILEIIRSMKSDYLSRPVKDYKITAKRRRQIIARKKEFDKLWPGRDFKKACAYAFKYKADEWIGTDMFRFFDPDTLLSEKFVSYLEKAEQDKGQPYTADKPKEEKIVYRING